VWSWDEAKRAWTLAQRGLDFADAAEIFDGWHVTMRDDRRDYGEARFITAGELRGRFVVLVWTPRRGGRRIRIDEAWTCGRRKVLARAA